MSQGESIPLHNGRVRDAMDRFVRSLPPTFDAWHDGTGYDLEILEVGGEAERKSVESILLSRSVNDWRDIEALAAVGTPSTIKRLRAAYEQGPLIIKIAVLMHAAEIVPDSEREQILIEALALPYEDGTFTQAMILIETHHSEKIRQVLWRGVASDRGNKAALFAAMLIYLYGKGESAYDFQHRPMLVKFLTEDIDERREALRELCKLLETNPSPGITEDD